MCLKWKCLSGRAPLKPIIGLRPVRGWPAGLTCHSSCLTLSQKNTRVKNSESRFTVEGFYSCVVVPHWLPRLAVMTAKHILIAGSGTDKWWHVMWQRQHNSHTRTQTHIQCFSNIVGTCYWFDSIWSLLIPPTCTLCTHLKHLIHIYLVTTLI